ncbi:MAG: hypothetical protein N4A41_04110 [Crocinitomicaceae bacterium]|jgi:hypothetical protein|nr:hypothetical protein [Crocinitomicaceae bacterium]
MKIITLLLSLGFFTLIGHSQTKSIFAKRHEMNSFCAGLDHVETNLGMAPERWVRHSELKKITKINDSVVVMETDLSCEEKLSREQTKWRPGKDTTLNHPVFTADIPVDSMRRILQETYFFENDMAEVKFEGFDTKPNNKSRLKTPKDEQTDQPPTKNEDRFPSKKKSKRPLGTWVLIIVLLTSAAGVTQLK